MAVDEEISNGNDSCDGDGDTDDDDVDDDNDDDGDDDGDEISQMNMLYQCAAPHHPHHPSQPSPLITPGSPLLRRTETHVDVLTRWPAPRVGAVLRL